MPRRKIPHFRLYQQDFLNGTRGMTDAEVGAYARILFTIYDQGGPIEFDPERLRFLFGCRPTEVVKRVNRLVELGKIFVDSHNLIHNPRADDEIEIREKWREKHPESPEKTPGNSRENINENNKPGNKTHARTRPVVRKEDNLLGGSLAPKPKKPFRPGALAAQVGKPIKGLSDTPPRQGREEPTEQARAPPDFSREQVEASPALMRSKLMRRRS